MTEISVGVNTWSSHAVDELAKLPETKDAVRVAKKVAKHVQETGEKLTANLVKTFVESDNGVARKKAEKVEAKAREREKRDEEETLLVHHLEEFLKVAGQYRRVFEAVTDVHQWTEADRQSRDIVKRLAGELEAIASHLRS